MRVQMNSQDNVREKARRNDLTNRLRIRINNEKDSKPPPQRKLPTFETDSPEEIIEKLILMKEYDIDYLIKQKTHDNVKDIYMKNIEYIYNQKLKREFPSVESAKDIYKCVKYFEEDR